MIMPFGKYKGLCLPDIPADYLRWLLAKCHTATEDLRRAVRQELNRRDDPGPTHYGAYRAVRDSSPPADLTADALEARIIRILICGEQSGNFGRGPLLDALWEAIATAFSMLADGPMRGQRSVGELIALARRLERN